MAGKSPERAYEAKLKEIDARLKRMPGSVALRYDRATLLDRLGRNDPAKRAYLDVLERDPKHFAAINNLAMLLYKGGQRQEAFLLYAEAVERHPDNAVAHANLAFMFLKANEAERARAHYERALALDAKNVEAQRGLAAVLTQLGDRDAAAPIAAAGGSVAVLPFRGRGKPVSVLLLVTLGSGNVAVERLLDDRTFQTIKLTVELHGPQAPLPEHDIIFNAVGDADEAKDALELARALVSRTSSPVLNDPRTVLATGRERNAARLRGQDGIVVPLIELVARDVLAGPLGSMTLEARGFAFPLLLRSPGYHTGRHFVLVQRSEDLAGAVAALPGSDLFAIEFLDTRNAAGEFYKYRVMFAGGEIYPLHMAIGHDWKLHYFSSDMAESADHRAREAAFLSDMHATLGVEAVQSIGRVGEVLGLDYAGIDFTLDRQGRVVVFEANATMIVVPPNDDERWAYKKAAVKRIDDAVHSMLLRRAAEERVS